MKGLLKNDNLLTMRLSTAAIVTSGAVLGGVSAAAAWGSASRTSQLFGPSIYRGPGRRRSIALTFDDGPSEGTEELLEYLDRERVWATFFMCGMNVRRLPRIAGQVAAAGHEIGNHTYSHPSLPFKSSEFIDREFTEAQRIIFQEIGISPMMLRPPYGLRWPGMCAVQQKLSLLAVLWTVIGNDWRLPADRIAARVLRCASPGGIVCLHDGRTIQPNPNISETIWAVERIVPILKDQGYTFEIVSDLLN
jgi:peptidoglycan/xylan/chitin deacetylase (PgdA/CDA1 family)